jgi:hypothetical protein
MIAVNNISVSRVRSFLKLLHDTVVNGEIVGGAPPTALLAGDTTHDVPNDRYETFWAESTGNRAEGGL